jgi:hypothetical protein
LIFSATVSAEFFLLFKELKKGDYCCFGRIQNDGFHGTLYRLTHGAASFLPPLHSWRGGSGVSRTGEKTVNSYRNETAVRRAHFPSWIPFCNGMTADPSCTNLNKAQVPRPGPGKHRGKMKQSDVEEGGMSRALDAALRCNQPAQYYAAGYHTTVTIYLPVETVARV